MAVDFASKQRDRGGDGWGLRNAKLQMSRKLIFASGLLLCFSCHINQDLQSKISTSESGINRIHLGNHLWGFAGLTPLDIVAKSISEYEIPNKVAVEFFGAYDEFLATMSNEEARSSLRSLRAENSRTDQVFGQVKKFGNRFDAALAEIFFGNSQLKELTQKYGVF